MSDLQDEARNIVAVVVAMREAAIDDETITNAVAKVLAKLKTISKEPVRDGACARCGKPFLTGPGTGRRSHRLYCSDSCRVMAMRERQAKFEAA